MQINYYGAEHPSRLLDKLLFGRFNSTFEPARTRFDWLSRDSQEVDAYIADPYCGFVCSALFYRDFFEGLNQTYRTHEMRKIPNQLPVYIISGLEDPVGETGNGIRRLYKQLVKSGNATIDNQLYTGARHELLNEINRAQVIIDLMNWLNMRGIKI
jgi:alpha-beta hydrolase superfamily lysophospholipase